jgi:hypothetical protein
MVYEKISKIHQSKYNVKSISVAKLAKIENKFAVI